MAAVLKDLVAKAVMGAAASPEAGTAHSTGIGVIAGNPYHCRLSGRAKPSFSIR